MAEATIQGKRPDPDEIYVGYLPVPPRQRRFLRVAVPVGAWLLCAMTFLWARSQNAPGISRWDDQHARTFSGLVIAEPYPMLFVDDADGAGSTPLLLVEVGKHGGQRAAVFHGKRVTVSGWVLRRDGRTMLEMEPGAAAFSPKKGTSDPLLTEREPSMPPVTVIGRSTLRGEIVDAKCYLGAMRPGEGKTHKDCATLCIRGGIPPVLVVNGRTGNPEYYLLTNEQGGALDVSVLPLVADPVEMTGVVGTWGGSGGGEGGLRVLRVGVKDIRRL